MSDVYLLSVSLLGGVLLVLVCLVSCLVTILIALVPASNRGVKRKWYLQRNQHSHKSTTVEGHLLSSPSIGLMVSFQFFRPIPSFQPRGRKDKKTDEQTAIEGEQTDREMNNTILSPPLFSWHEKKKYCYHTSEKLRESEYDNGIGRSFCKGQVRLGILFCFFLLMA